MASTVKIKRSSIQGKAPTTSNIETGELALNLRDQKLFSSNGSVIFEVGSNLESSSVGTLIVGNSNPLVVASDGNAIFQGDITANNNIFLDTVRQVNSDVIRFNQKYSGSGSPSYLVGGEYQKIINIVPDGNSQNYQIIGRMTAQSGGNAHVINFQCALRSTSLPDLDFSMSFDENISGSGTRYIKPRLWTKETSPAEFVLVAEIENQIFGGLTVDIDVIPRSEAQGDNVTINKVDGSEVSSVDSGFTDRAFTKTFAIVNGVQEYATQFRFEGSSEDGSETTINVTDPTADRTITFPDATGTVALTSDVTGISNVVEDTTPQLGGDLDLNSNDITGTGNVNITGTGTFTTMTDGTVSFTDGNISGVNELRINQNGTGLRMTNVGAFDNDTNDNFRIFATGNLVFSSNGSDNTRLTIKEDGDIIFADGTIDVDIASHDGTNGLKLGGTLVTASATELNLLDGLTSLNLNDYLEVANSTVFLEKANAAIYLEVANATFQNISEYGNTTTQHVQVGGLTIGQGGSAYEFPTTDGAALQILQTDGSGQLTFVALEQAEGGGFNRGTLTSFPTGDYFEGGTTETFVGSSGEAGSDAFGVSLTAVYDCMDPNGRVITEDLGAFT